MLELRRDNDGWIEQIRPVDRFLPDPAPHVIWWHSSIASAASRSAVGHGRFHINRGAVPILGQHLTHVAKLRPLLLDPPQRVVPRYEPIRRQPQHQPRLPPRLTTHRSLPPLPARRHLHDPTRPFPAVC